MFGGILLSSVTLMHAYVLWRAGTVPFVRRFVPGKGLVAGGVLLWLVFLAGRVYGHGHSGSLATLLELYAMTWMAVLFLTLVPLLCVDIATGFGLLFPGVAPSLRGSALVCGFMLSLIALVQGTRASVVRNYEVEMPGLPSRLDGTVIVGLSDLHIGSTLDGKWLKQRVAQAQAERPDMVVLLGDIFEGHSRPSKEHVAALQGLRAPMGVWAVLGNHEFHGSESSLAADFQSAGITVLRNEKATPAPGLALAGIDDLTSLRRSGPGIDPVRKALAPSKNATVLLSHTPWNADRAAKAGAGLMLCGHTHGGQIWPFGYLVGRIYPLIAGRYDVEGMTVIVSRGAGTWGPRMRLWEPGEIIRVTLRAKETA